MDPWEELIGDLFVEEVLLAGEQEQPSGSELAAAEQRLAALRERIDRESKSRVELAERGRQVFHMEVGAASTLAAADVVKVTDEFELGTIRMIESTMRADLAIEIVLNEHSRVEYTDCVSFVQVGGKSLAIAVLPDASPVFSGLYAEDFSTRNAVSIELVPFTELDESQLDAVKRSRRSLKNPADREKYDAVLNRD